MLFSGRKIKNRYVTESLIHRGSLSSVYIVSDLEIPGRKYILKQIVDTRHNPAGKKLAEFLFHKETGKLKEIKYDNMARVYDGFHESGRFYVLQEYIEGTSLKKITEHREPASFGDTEVFEYFKQVTDIVIYLNSLSEKKKIFRDIRPESFVLTMSGRVYLVDNGLSHVFLTMEELALKLKDFNSPEVVRREKYDEKSDVYAIGAVIYFLVTGKVPGEFSGKPPKADRFNRNLSKRLVKLLEDCMEPRNKRVENLVALKNRIFEIENKVQEESRNERIKQEEYRLTESDRKKRMKIFLGFLLFLILAAPICYFAYFHYTLALCEKNCMEIGTALNNYANAHNGIYPEKLSQLVPNYLKKIPKCPAKFKDTYSKSYKSYNFPGLKYCKFCCCGKNHTGNKIPENFPCFNSYNGMVSKPGEDYENNPVEKLLNAYRQDSKGNYSLAVKNFRDLTVMDEKKLRDEAKIEKYIVFWNMARVLEKTGKKKEAKKKYRTAAVLLMKQNLKSFNKNVVLLLIEDLKRLGDGSFALHFFNTLTNKYVVEKLTPDVRIISEMVEVYEKMGKKSQGLKLLRKFLSKAPPNEKVFISAEFHRLKGNKAKAKVLYKKYLRLKGAKKMTEKALRQ